MKIFTLPLMVCLGVSPAFANILPLDDALRATYTACIGIDEQLHDLKTMAGISTAVTAVGSATGAGAMVTGLVKADKDKQAADLEKLIQELEEMEKDTTPPTPEQVDAFLKEFELAYDVAVKELETYRGQLGELEDKSKKLGNWRTGLMAGSAATNVAGAIMSGTNKVDGDLMGQITACRTAVANLRTSIGQARISGLDVSEANAIASACGEYDYADLSKVNTKATGAMVSSILGAASGVVGTGLSAGANSNPVRNDNTDAGHAKEKNLNTASNVMAGVTTAASVTATVFNATQIKAIKQVAEIAAKCTGVLK